MVLSVHFRGRRLSWKRQRILYPPRLYHSPLLEPPLLGVCFFLFGAGSFSRHAGDDAQPPQVVDDPSLLLQRLHLEVRDLTRERGATERIPRQVRQTARSFYQSSCLKAVFFRQTAGGRKAPSGWPRLCAACHGRRLGLHGTSHRRRLEYNRAVRSHDALFRPRPRGDTRICGDGTSATTARECRGSRHSATRGRFRGRFRGVKKSRAVGGKGALLVTSRGYTWISGKSAGLLQSHCIAREVCLSRVNYPQRLRQRPQMYRVENVNDKVSRVVGRIGKLRASYRKTVKLP